LIRKAPKTITLCGHAEPNNGFNRTPESSAAAKPGEFGGGAG